MRKILTSLGLVFLLTLAPAAAVTAEAVAVPAAYSQITPSPQPTENRDEGGSGGMWGLLGLLGLLGLAGLRKQKARVGTAEHMPNPPRP
ncbi:hypothetical protein GCM10010412_092860 [Nonomuraea recticatena]|uniref:MYXO-CTERM domain-containing protein n=1 Tax=Nonomuraea recticatena TaxID=46178 RepID=A0ABP6FPN4_9ACTN